MSIAFLAASSEMASPTATSHSTLRPGRRSSTGCVTAAFEGGLLDVRHHDIHAAVEKRARQAEADAAGGAGDERSLSLEIPSFSSRPRWLANCIW